MSDRAGASALGGVRTLPEGNKLKYWRCLASVVALALAGCATPGVEELRGAAGSLYTARSAAALPPASAGNDSKLILTEMLARSVDADAAVQIAFLQNPRVAAIFARVGFARADLYDATRLSNPAFGYARLSSGGDGQKIDWSLSQNFTELLFLRFRKASAESGVLLTEQQVASALLDLEADVRGAQVRFVASRTMAGIRDHIEQATRIAAGYAQQLFDAGNISALQLARMQEAAQLAAAETLRAHATELSDRNALLTLMGLGHDSPVALSGELNVPGTASVSTAEVKAWAMGNRLDLLSAREALRFALIDRSHARRWAWLGETTVGVTTEKDTSPGSASSGTRAGPTANLELPIFNVGAGAIGRAESAADLLAADVRSLELSIGNDIATRIAALDAAYQAVELYRGKIVPTQNAIVEESQKQQNYMLVGIPELLAAKQHQYDGYESYIAALREYWSAYVDLCRAAGGRFPGAKAIAEMRKNGAPPGFESISAERQ